MVSTARYGVSTYGTAFFGEPVVSLYSADPFVARESGYGEVELTWRSPGGGWDELLLVRNDSGYPSDHLNGVALYSARRGGDRARYVDSGRTPDRWTYYSIFVYDSVYADWIRSGDVSAYVAAPYFGAEWMYQFLPSVYRGADFAVSDEGRASSPLVAFMSVFGFQYDVLRNAINSLLDLHNPDRVNYDLIPLLLDELGVDAEHEIGPEQYRRFAANAVHLHKTRGTRNCVQGVVSAITGYDSVTVIGTNMLWDSDLSDLAGGVGQWGAQPVDCTVTRVGPEEDSPTGPLPSRLRMTSTAVGTSDISTSFVGEEVLLSAINVTPGEDYAAGGYASASDLGRSPARLRLDWYALDGSPLGSTLGDPVATRQMLLSPVSVAGTAPENAVLAGLTAIIEDAAPAATYDWAAFQMNAGPDLLPHEAGREVYVVLYAQRVNRLTNPSFEANINGWVPLGNVTVERDGTKAASGDASLRVVLDADQGAGGPDGVAALFDTTEGRRYAVQFEVSADVLAGGGRVTVDVCEDVDSPFVAPEQYRSVDVAEEGGDFVRYSLAFTAGAAQAALRATFQGADAPSEFHLDAVLAESFEVGAPEQYEVSPDYDEGTAGPLLLQPYFDGSGVSYTGDYLWEGAPHASRSHFYYRRTVHEARLRDVLPRYLPIGAAFQLRWAPPAPVVYFNDDVVLSSQTTPPPTAPVSRDLHVRWRQYFVGAALSRLDWGVTATVGRDLDARWRDRSPVGASVGLVWSIEVPVGAALGILWDVIA